MAECTVGWRQVVEEDAARDPTAKADDSVPQNREWSECSQCAVHWCTISEKARAVQAGSERVMALDNAVAISVGNDQAARHAAIIIDSRWPNCRTDSSCCIRRVNRHNRPRVMLRGASNQIDPIRRGGMRS